MSPLYLYNGKLLMVGGALATSSGCCCEQCEECGMRLVGWCSGSEDCESIINDWTSKLSSLGWIISGPTTSPISPVLFPENSGTILWAAADCYSCIVMQNPQNDWNDGNKNSIRWISLGDAGGEPIPFLPNSPLGSEIGDLPQKSGCQIPNSTRGITLQDVIINLWIGIEGFTNDPSIFYPSDVISPAGIIGMPPLESVLRIEGFQLFGLNQLRWSMLPTCTPQETKLCYITFDLETIQCSSMNPSDSTRSDYNVVKIPGSCGSCDECVTGKTDWITYNDYDQALVAATTYFEAIDEINEIYGSYASNWHCSVYSEFESIYDGNPDNPIQYKIRNLYICCPRTPDPLPP